MKKGEHNFVLINLDKRKYYDSTFSELMPESIGLGKKRANRALLAPI